VVPISAFFFAMLNDLILHWRTTSRSRLLWYTVHTVLAVKHNRSAPAGTVAEPAVPEDVAAEPVKV
jgi:hypothetical protein